MTPNKSNLSGFTLYRPLGFFLLQMKHCICHIGYVLPFAPWQAPYFVWSLIYFTCVSASELIRFRFQTPPESCCFRHLEASSSFPNLIKDVARLDIITISKGIQEETKHKHSGHVKGGILFTFSHSFFKHCLKIETWSLFRLASPGIENIWPLCI